MEIEIADATGLPEALKAIAVTADGKTKINLAGLVPAAEVDTWKTKVQEANAESAARRNEIKAWKALGADPAEIQAKLAKGADPAIIDQMRSEFAAKETGFKAQLQKIVADRAVSDLKGELAKAGVIPTALDDIAHLARGQMRIEDDGSVSFLTPDGKPMIGQGANGGATAADFAKALAAARPYAVADQGQGGTGRDPKAGAGNPGGKTMKRDAFNSLDQFGRASFVKEGGKVID